MLNPSTIFYINFFSFWGLPLIGAIATLITVLVSQDEQLRRSAIYNLFFFMLGTLFLFFVKRQFFPSYGFVMKLRSDWLPFQGWNILLYLLFADFIFYAYHRLTHFFPLLWIGHFSHHATDKLHLSLPLRENILIHIFVLPLPIFGIPLGLSPEWVFFWLRIIIFYQIFLHIHVSKDIPLLKYILVTPYFHIIHHSKKFDGSGQNFGGLFSFWDRIFGTYREGQEYLKEFGLEGLQNTNSLWTLNVEPLTDLARQCWQKRSLKPLVIFPEQRLSRQLPSILLYVFCAGLFVDLFQRLYQIS